MAQFYGTIQGQAGETHRIGNKNSGLDTVAASWEGAVSVRLYYDDKDGHDYAEVYLIPWRGHGVNRLVWRGRVDGAPSWVLGEDAE
jgi:hypothetical protein